MPRVVLIFAAEGGFRRERAFSQRRALFAAHFAAAKIGLLCCEMAHECQRGVSQLRNTLRNEAIAAKIENLTLWGFRSHFAAAKWSYCAAKWHTSAKRWFRSCENFRRGGCWAAKFISQRRAIFAAKPRFRRDTKGLRNHFRSRWPFSQGAILGCEISQTIEISWF